METGDISLTCSSTAKVVLVVSGEKNATSGDTTLPLNYLVFVTAVLLYVAIYYARLLLTRLLDVLSVEIVAYIALACVSALSTNKIRPIMIYRSYLLDRGYIAE